jgi:hypothetical protein
LGCEELPSTVSIAHPGCSKTLNFSHTVTRNGLNASPADQVDDKNHESDYQQKMNQASGDMKAEAQQPEDEQNDKNRPKHEFLQYADQTRLKVSALSKL